MFRSKFRSVFRSLFKPPASIYSAVELLPLLLACFITMLVVGLVSTWLSPHSLPLLLVASGGASIMLIFILPHNPLSQPYPLIVGQLTCALIGVACSYLPTYLPIDLPLVAAICITMSLLTMFLLRCDHPPGVATAMTPVIAGSGAVGGFYFVIFPVLINVLVILLLGIAFHRWWLKADYPERVLPKDDSQPEDPQGILTSDLQAALKTFDGYLDISEQDLLEVYRLMQQQADQRQSQLHYCVDIMLENAKAVTAETPLEEAWAFLHSSDIKLLPVIDQQRKVIGTLTLTDFLALRNLQAYPDFAERLINLVSEDRDINHHAPQHVGEIMAKPAFTVNQQMSITDLVPLLSDEGLHHIPVVNDQQQLVGIIDCPNLLKALYETKMGH